MIASGIVPPGMEGADTAAGRRAGAADGPARPRHRNRQQGERYSPSGSRLAVSTNLLACLISLCMRATSQIRTLTGGLDEDDRRLVAARAILGEWLGGLGRRLAGFRRRVAGNQADSRRVAAQEGDPGIRHQPRPPAAEPSNLRPGRGVRRKPASKLQQSLVLVHGGMAQDVGPILEMVTEKYLLRSETEWRGRQRSHRHSRRGDGALEGRRRPRPSARAPSGISTAPSRPLFRGPATCTPTR